MAPVRSLALGLCLGLPMMVSAPAEAQTKVEAQSQIEAPGKAEAPGKDDPRPFRKGNFAVHSAQGINPGSVALSAEMGYPFLSTGVIFGLGPINLGAQVKSEWALTIGGDAFVLVPVWKKKTQALAVKVEGGVLTRGAGDPEVLAFGPGAAGVNDPSTAPGGLPHAFSATTHATVTPQIVYSRQGNPGTWLVSGGAMVQQFLEQPLDLPAELGTPEIAIMPRVTGGIERVMSDNISFHAEGLFGLYLDPNEVDEATNTRVSDTAAIVMFQIGLNLFLP